MMNLQNRHSLRLRVRLSARTIDDMYVNKNAVKRFVLCAAMTVAATACSTEGTQTGSEGSCAAVCSDGGPWQEVDEVAPYLEGTWSGQLPVWQGLRLPQGGQAGTTLVIRKAGPVLVCEGVRRSEFTFTLDVTDALHAEFNGDLWWSTKQAFGHDWSEECALRGGAALVPKRDVQLSESLLAERTDAGVLIIPAAPAATDAGPDASVGLSDGGVDADDSGLDDPKIEAVFVFDDPWNASAPVYVELLWRWENGTYPAAFYPIAEGSLSKTP